MKKLIRNVNVFDGKNSQLQIQRNIVIEENIVSAIETGDISEDVFDEVIDGKGLTAMPGLIDAHVHLGTTFMPDGFLDYDIAVSAAIAKKMLMQGFTTVRDAGGIVQGLKKVFDQGILDGPRIFPCNSCISQTCGHGDNYDHSIREIQYKIPTGSVLADGVPEVIRAVREQFYKGASQIKIMAGGGCASKYDPLQTVQFSLEEMKAAVNTASDYGTYVMAHLYTPECMKRAAKAGIKSFEHAHMMDEETAKMIQSEGIFVAPMPQFNKPRRPDQPVSKKGLMVREKEQNATELINKYDLKILFGTDLMIMSPDQEPSDSIDLTYYKKRFGSFKGLLAATGNVYDVFQLSTYQNPYPDGKLGVLEKGSYADILLVQGNPVEDLDILSEVDNIKLIMKDSKVYKNVI